MSIKKNDEIKLFIEALSSEGSGVGHYGNMAVFVENTAAGDEITAHIIKVKSSYAIGKVTELLKPSADRISAKCDSFTRCGGCAYSHISYESEKKWKWQRVKDSLERIGHIELDPDEIIGAECTERYRNKAQYPVGMGRGGELITGFFSRRSHRIAECEDCLLQPESFKSILQAIKCWGKKCGVTAYSEESGKGLLRHIYIRRGYHTGETMVCLVINGKDIPDRDGLIRKLLDTDSGIKSIVLNINREKTNVILGDSCKSIYGDGYIRDILCTRQIRISPMSFYQVNTQQAEKLYKKAAELSGLTGEETLLDLYCGAGTIGLSMAERAKKVIGVEIIPEAVEDARENAKINGITNAEFICDDAAGAARKLIERGERPDVIVVDPPRKGCSAELIESAVKLSPERIVYVSCDPATLARDCKIFGEKGYEIKKAVPVDMFPRTEHVETVVLLSKFKVL